MKQPSLISDELLSAYIDHQINEAELRRVEKALAVEPNAQYRLKTLQATVALMRNAPTLAVPHTFALSESQALAAGGRVKGVSKISFWEQWLPRLMPAATAIVALLFVFSLTLTPASDAPQQVEMLAAPAATEITAAPAPAMAREAPAAAEPDVQALSAEQRPSPRSAPPRNAAATEAPAMVMEQDASEAAKEPSAESKSAPAASTSIPEKHLYSVSWVTWLLGLLLILGIFLTWRITFARSRRR